MMADDRDIITKVNHMLEMLDVRRRIRNVEDITSEVFVLIFDGVCGDLLKDVIRSPISAEEHVHNVQSVIDSLSMDVLNISLSHITGQSIVHGNKDAMYNLLEVLSGLMDFMQEEIASDSQSIDERSDGRSEIISENSINGKINALHTHDNDPQHDRHSLMFSNETDSHLSNETDRHMSYETDRHLPYETDRHLPYETDSHLSNKTDSHLSDETDSHLFKETDSQLKKSSMQQRIDQRIEHNRNTNQNHSGSMLGLLKEPQNDILKSNTFSVKHTDVSHNAAYKPILGTHVTQNRYKTNDAPSLSQEMLVESHSIRPQMSRDVPSFIEDCLSVRTVAKPSCDVSSAWQDEYVDFEDLHRNVTMDNRQTMENRSQLPDEVFPPRLTHSAIYPKTYPDYLQKYYGDLGKDYTERSSVQLNGDVEEDASFLNDGCIDYKSVNSVDELNKESSFERQLALCKNELRKKAKAVHFDDYLDNSANGHMGTLRRKFRDEERKTRIRKEFLGKTYAETLAELEEKRTLNRKEANKVAKVKDLCYQNLLAKKTHTDRHKMDSYSVPVGVLTSRSRSVGHLVSKNVKCRVSTSSLDNHKGSPDNDILPWLLEEFPFLHLSPTTLHSICRKSAQQLEYLSKGDTASLRQKSKVREQIVDAERKQKILVDIAQKEQGQKQRLKETIERQKHEMCIRVNLREKRLQSARIRKYYDEYQVRQRSKMLKKKTKEELVFKDLFSDGLRIQKERITELRKYAKEQRDLRAKKQQQELESIENYYRDQFSMLSESMRQECTDFNTRDKAQSLVLDQMKKALRIKMEKEISELQKRIWKDEDDLYFRELDAERVLEDLNLTRFQARI